MDLKRIESLLQLLAEHDVTEFTYKDDDISLKLRLGPPPAVTSLAPMAHVAAAPTPMASQAPEAAPAPAAAAPEADDPDLVTVESPMVGTFYRAPSPDAKVFCNVGDRVRSGQTLCIVEAMKLMNEIEAEVGGVVAEILVDNGEPVQFGQPLFKIRRG